MKRRNFIKNSALGIAVASTGLSSAFANTQKPMKETIAHYVLFWLRPDLSAQEVASFTGFFEELNKIPSKLSLSYGPAAKTNPRDVVDNTFSYNLLVEFKDLTDLGIYEVHPIHLNAIEKYKHLWTKVVVHDSVLQKA
ncbi:Dabb family protein [Sphingobacteriaceae bacterium WQ 2009]|uniref:Dabb family protein n=1 Tax=Rhinopithecimicrobium faecis TaxID=2820698 RepID=A0A8T4H8R1_9SPHI|nr:Dabb family protein [Sphingobacteriaceae bacterium WQ 2009]